MGPEYSREEVARLHEYCRTARGSRAPGAALEDLVEYLFRSVPSVVLFQRDVCDESGAQEVDLVFSHLHFVSRFPIPDVTIVIECKNEATALRAADVREFASKLVSRALHIGVLVTSGGLSGSDGRHGHGAIRDVLAQGVAVIVATTDELSRLRCTDDLVELLTSRLVELRTYRGYHTV
jgi:Restriction endonuclease